MRHPRTEEENRKGKVARDDMRKNWDIQWVNRIITRKIKPWYVKLWHFLLYKRYTVSALYSFFQEEAFQHMSFPKAINADQIISKEYPTKYELVNNWSIPEKDIKHLIKGPLFSETGDVLVDVDTRLNRILRIIWKIFQGIVVSITTFGSFYIGLSIILNIMKFIKSFFGI